MPGKTWKIPEKTSEDLITQLLLNRGIKTEQEIKNFFNPKLSDFEKELDIPQIEKGIKRIQKAIEGQELIIVYGDYDVDGVSACAVLYKGLTAMGAKVLPYIPHREKEGYGLSKTGLEFARDSGATLVITVDNGIVAIEQAKFAREIGLDLIITDHHTPLVEKPDALAIVHSTKMCGAAVAWCLIRNSIKKELSRELLQFVAIATITDMIPLVGVGRAFVKEGIKVLNQTDNLGLISLFNETSIKEGQIGSYEIGHIIGPRLNAIGRIEHAIDALRLLCTKDPVKAKKLAKLLTEANIKRQDLTIKALEEASVMVGKTSNKKIHVLYSTEWHSGIIGLIAGRVQESHGRPAIAMAVGEVHAKGSARSSNGINITEAIRKCSDILVDVGGHSGAAGLTILKENIPSFKERIEKYLEEEVMAEHEESLEIEAEVDSQKLSKSLAKRISELEPFGFGNKEPLLATFNMTVTDIKTVGAEGKHLKIKADGIDAIAFGMGDLKQKLKSGDKIDLAYYLQINKFNGQEYLQLKVKDLKII